MANVRDMSVQDKIAETIRRSLPLLPAGAREQVQAMLSPESLAIMAGTLVVWAGSHFFGIGEIVDVILLVAGFAVLGLSVFSGAQELYAFGTAAVNAQSDPDLDRAAQHFSRAVNILGISVISAVLLRRSAQAVVARGRPQIRPRMQLGPPPSPGLRPRITRPFSLPSGALGETDWWGNIAVARNQTLTEQRLTLYHEWVHGVLSPRFSPLRALRAELRASAYWRSALMRYLEEAMAESYAQLRVHGLQQILVGIRFPIRNGYVTVSQLATEGRAIGNIT
ncbi:MAG TPA: hypothetical protein VF590_06905, partial [Isosphaeraceae bacterium]